MIWKIIYCIRNLVWKIRIAWKGDPLEVEASGIDYCFTTGLSLNEIEKKLLENGFVLQKIAQYEYSRQVVGGQSFIDYNIEGCPLHQHHVRVLERNDAKFDIYCHREWTWQADWKKHLNAVDYEKKCEKVVFLRSG